MFRNYIKIAFRNMMKSKAYSAINLIGLAVGLSAFILIALYVQFELSFDRYHENADRIYRAARNKPGGPTGALTKTAVTPAPLAPALMEEFPEVEIAARFIRNRDVLISYEETHLLEENFYWADNEIFDVFTIPFIAGDPKTALHDPFSILLSSSTANKYFGSDDPMGRLMTVSGQQTYKVAGVFEDMPVNSHFIMDVIVPYQTYFQLFGADINHWGANYSYTYFLLQDGANPEALEQKLPAFLEKYVYQFYEIPDEYKTQAAIQPLTRIHLHSHRNQEIEANSDMIAIILFASVAFLFLIIACMNYMNLATARSVQRGREVGIRKVAGAQRIQLARQFLGEAVVMTLIALSLAVVIVLVTLHSFNALVERQLEFNPLNNPALGFGIIILAGFVGIFSGSYPAMCISGFKPIAVLSGTFQKSATGLRLRNILVVAQFSISIFFIIFTFIVRDQLAFVKNRDMGYGRDQIMVLELRDRAVRQNIQAIKTELMQYANIEDISTSYRLPNNIDEHVTRQWNSENPETVFEMYYNMSDYDYVNLFDLEIVEGRNFSRDFPSDAQGAFLVNEAAVRAAGWKNAIGHHLEIWNGVEGDIVGVIKDFHMHSLHRPIEPAFIFLTDNRLEFLSIKIKTNDLLTTVDFVKSVMKRFSPTYPFEYSFFDDVFEQDYQMEQKMSAIFRSISILAIIVACFGLFGLSTFAAEQRTKEIGIRKILGAPITGVITLLSREFMKWVLLSNIIAWPVAYFAAEKWLQNFSYRMKPSIWAFAISAVSAFIIALITVSFQSIRAAMSNPVDSLKYE